jgi:hypothetical protein
LTNRLGSLTKQTIATGFPDRESYHFAEMRADEMMKSTRHIIETFDEIIERLK